MNILYYIWLNRLMTQAWWSRISSKNEWIYYNVCILEYANFNSFNWLPFDIWKKNVIYMVTSFS